MKQKENIGFFKIFIVAVIVISIGKSFNTCINDRDKSHPPKKTYNYTLLKTRNIDTAAGARRTVYDIEVSTDTNDEKIKMILKYAVKELSKKREVDAMSVRLYLTDTNLPYAIADWAPYGDWAKAERGKAKSIFETSIKIYPERRPQKSSNVVKYGLPLEQRKIIFQEVIRSQKNTRKTAEEKYPSDVMKQYDYMEKLDKEYESAICMKYFISDDQKCKIMDEGIKNNWSEK
ncbi:hypothetical protein KJ762_11840 [bacterium]|nr:hypothetical protein [bacterium]MBU1874088.1 hypothetical protein [bacterium]